jgi:tetratricopeptide (TPR) repeat protein
VVEIPVRRALLALVLLGAACFTWAVESDPLPVPKGSPREAAVNSYNEGTRLLLQRDFSGAQRLFEDTLRQQEDFAEAHNNLAYSLRMQSSGNFERSLRHYNRAIELKPSLAQAYMYRGMLFVQMGDLERARADHARLLALDSSLAERLSKAMATQSEGDGRAGIASQYEY